MPSRKKTKAARAAAARMSSIPKEIIDQFVTGPLQIDTPRDRDGSFEPILIPKHARRFTGFDDKIIAMYSWGMTVCEIQAFLAEQYGIEVSPEFISSVSDEVMDEIARLADPSAGENLSGGVLRCVAGEDA